MKDSRKSSRAEIMEGYKVSRAYRRMGGEGMRSLSVNT